jgi:hypothetical protein
MADNTQPEEDLRTFCEQFESIRVELNIATSPESVQNLTFDLIQILILQTQPKPAQPLHEITMQITLRIYLALDRASLQIALISN